MKRIVFGAAAIFGAFIVGQAAVVASLWFLGLMLCPAGLMMLAFAPPKPERKPEPVGAPARPDRSPRYPDGAPEGTCPICGMDDPDRLELGIGEDDWRGHAAHSTCVEWLGDWEPPRKATDRERQMLPLGAVTWTCGSTAGTILGTNVAAGAGGGGGGGGGVILNYVLGASHAEAAILSSFGVPPPMMGTAPTIRRSAFEHEPWPLNLPRAGSTMPATRYWAEGDQGAR